MRINILILVGLALLGAGAFYLSCCDDCPTCPPAPKEEHIFYVSAFGDGIIKTFSVEQRKFIDSFFLPCQLYGLNLDVIGDNEMLATCSYREGVRIIDLRTRQIAYNYPLWLTISVSRGSEYFAVLKALLTPDPKLLELYKFDGFEMIYRDTTDIAPRFGMQTRYLSHVLLTGPDSGAVLTTYDIWGDSVAERTMKRINDVPLIFLHALPVSRYKKVFFGTLSLYGNALCVSDIGSDTARILMVTGPYLTEYVVSPDEKYLYLAIPPGWDEPDNNRIFVFDVESEQQIAEMTTGETGQQPGQMAVTSDGKYLLAGTASGMTRTSDVALFDARAFKFLGIYGFVGAPGAPQYPTQVATKTK